MAPSRDDGEAPHGVLLPTDPHLGSLPRPYCSAMGASLLADLTPTSGPKSGYDVALLLESLEHVQQKQRLLHKLRQVSRTLVLRTSCIPSLGEGEHSVVFSGSMSLTSCTGIEDAVRAAGWRLTV
eukprot:scaffold138629_cov160-Phaeocystis_antarctica.AAC.1